MTNRTRHRTEAELKLLFEQAVRAIGFYEAQRKEVLMALESLRRALAARVPPLARKVWQPILARVPSSAARRWIMRQASTRFIAFTVSVPARPTAERKRGVW